MTPELAETAQRLEDNLKGAASETEHLLKVIGKEGSEQLADAKVRLGHHLTEARQELARMRHETAEQARAAAKATDTLAHEHPWAAVGIAAATGALVAWLLTRR